MYGYIALIAVTAFCNACASESMEVGKRPLAGLETVAEVDLSRYMGRWYEIASYPQWFEKGMSHVSAVYIPKEGYVEVINAGLKNGKMKEAHGKARVVDGSGGAKLRVSFFWPIYGDYWIIDLASDYTWSVVSNSKRSTLWILSRTEKMDEATYQAITVRLAQKGFDLRRLVRMQQE